MKVTWIRETANRNGSGGILDVLQWGQQDLRLVWKVDSERERERGSSGDS